MTDREINELARKLDYSSLDAYKKSIAPARAIGAAIAQEQAAAAAAPKIVPLKTAWDMQKKKEDSLDVKSAVNSAEIKRDRAKRDYENYIKSDEYRQRLAENDQRNKQQEVTNLFLPPEMWMQPKVIQDEKELKLRAAMEAAEAEYNASEDRKVIEADMEAVTGLSEEERKQLEQYAVNQIRDQNMPMEFQNSPFFKTAEQEASGLIGKIGKQRADELAETYMRQENEKFAEDVAAKGREHAGTGFWSGVGSSLATVPINLAAGVVGSTGQLQAAARNTGRYKTLDPNATGTALQNYTGAVRGQVGQNISGDVYDEEGNLVKEGGALRGLGSLAYQGIMSGVDSAARAAVGGGTGGAILAAANSFSQTMADASAKGATPQQAVLLAGATAGIEALSEKIPLDRLVDTAKAGKQPFKQIIKTALQQAGIEATTEEISMIGTILAEAAILKEKSSFNRDFMGKILNGIPPEQAKTEVMKGILKEAWDTALVSMISGAGSSVAGSTVANIGADTTLDTTSPAQKPVEEINAETAQTPSADTAEVEQKAAEPVSAQTINQNVQPTQAQQKTGESDKVNAAGAAGIVENIVSKARESGNVSNKDASRIMEDPEAMAKIQQQAGAEITGTNAEKRTAIKEIISRLAAENRAEGAAQEATQQLQAETQQSVQTETAPQNDGRTDVQQRATERVTESAEGEQPETQPTGTEEPGILGTGAAERNFTGTAAYDDLLRDDNVQRERKGDVRQEEVPGTDADGRKVSEAAGNIMNSQWTPDAVTGTIKKMIMDGKVSHDVMSNETALKNAAKAIESEGGAYESLQKIKEHAEKGWTSPEAVAKAELIYNHYANEVAKMEESGGADENTKNMVSDAFVTLAKLATNSGQSTQLFSVFRKMSPELQIRTIQKNVQRAVDEINKGRSGRKKTAVNTEAQKARKPVDEAIKTARKETGDTAAKAAGSVRFKNGKVTVDPKHKEPFVFEYAQKVGEALAKGLENSRKTKPQKTFLQTMTAELRKFAAEKMPPSQKNRNLTDTELLRDYIQNQDFYAEAWSAAQEALREKHGDDPYFQEFINSGIGVDGNANPQNKIMAKALAAAAMETGETTEMLRKQQALGITGMSDTIANKLIRDTGATGEMAQTIRDAAYEFVKNRINEGDSKENAKTYDSSYFVNEAMRDIRQTMSDIARKNTRDRAAARQAVVNALTKKYQIGQADANHIAEVVGDTFDNKAQEKAKQILAQKFGERQKAQPRNAGQMIEEYANLGAYAQDSQYSEKATESFLQAAMRDIGKTVTDLAKSGKADREAVRAQISKMITERHGIDKAEADRIAEVVGNQLEAMTQERAKQILEQRFADRPKSEKKTAMDMLTEYANLGAFDAGSEYNAKATAKIVGEKYDVTLREDLVQNFLKAKTDEQKAEAMDEIYRDVASRITPTLEEAWDEWRNLAMLFNPKTHERNFLSTGAFRPYVVLKRNIAAVMEAAFVDKENRTRAVLGFGKNSRDLVKWAKEDAKSSSTKKNFKDYGMGGNEAAQAIREYRKYLPGVLDKLSKWNRDTMELEDSVWKRAEYASSLASYLKAKGYTAEQAKKGQIPDSVMYEARQLAVSEAMKATFADRNRFSDTISKFRAKGSDPLSKSVNVLAKGVLPYAKTPANIVVRVKEYSPTEIARGFHTLAAKVKTGEATIAQGIDQIASGLTGAGVMLLGAALRDGLIPGVKLIGKADEEEKQEGATDYSVKIGDQYYGIGFLAPACIPLFIGAELEKAFPTWGDFWEASAYKKADALLEIGASSLNPMLELSVMSSLNSAIDSFKNADTQGEGVMNFLITSAANYFTQGLPTILGQAEQATETEKTAAYVNEDSKTAKIVKPIISNASQRIPGVDVYRTTKLDEWGQPIANGESQDKRINSALFNPVTVSKAKTDDLTKEIIRLNKAQTDINVSPAYFHKVVSYTDKEGNKHSNYRMTEEEYQTLAQTQGQTARTILETMIKSDNYAAMTDDQKAKAMQKVYSYAREKAMQAAFPDHLGYSESWMMDLKEGREAEQIMRGVQNSEFNRTMSNLTTAWSNGYSTGVTESYSRELEEAYNSYSKMSELQKLSVKDFATGDAARYIEAREKGVSHKDFLATAKAIDSIKTPDGKEANQKQKLDTVARSGLSESQKVIMAKLYATDAQDKNIDEVNTLTQKLRQEGKKVPQGSTFDLYTQLYRDHSDYTKGTGKKSRTINHWIQKYGMDYSTAKKYYEVFS